MAKIVRNVAGYLLLLGFKRNILLTLALWQHKIREDCVVCYCVSNIN